MILRSTICDALAPFVQFKKCRKHPWRRVSKIKGKMLKTPMEDTSPLVFSRFFKLHKWYQIAQRIT